MRCTIRSSALATCSRIAVTGSSMPAISTIVSIRESVSRGLFEWIVVSEPSWPVFIAWSMSSASAPRASPTMMRSGRIRSELRTRSRILISPVPSMFGGRDSSEHTCSCQSLSSFASSIVTMRSSFGMNDDSDVQQRRLTGTGTAGDDDVQPAAHARVDEVRDLRRERTERDEVADRVRVLRELPDREERVRRSRPGARPRSHGNRRADGRRPSATLSSTRRPTSTTILSIVRRRWPSSTNSTSVRSILPRRSM